MYQLAGFEKQRWGGGGEVESEILLGRNFFYRVKGT